ncbi:MAG: hypothetical protein AB7P04_06680 [Bacteriovoracia bacterium]
MVIWLALGFWLFDGAGLGARAYAGETEIRHSINEVLSQRHPTETAETWRSMGAGTSAVIIKMFEETSATYRRVRLLNGLQWFDDADAADFLKRQATDGPSAIRHTALASLARAQGVKELPFVSSFLTHEDVQTRFLAAKAIQDFMPDSAAVRETLTQYKQNEKETWVHARLQGKFQELPIRDGAKTDPPWEGSWTGTAVMLDPKWEPKAVSQKGGKAVAKADAKASPGFVTERVTLLIINLGKDHPSLEGEIELPDQGGRKLKLVRVERAKPAADAPLTFLARGGLSDSLAKGVFKRTNLSLPAPAPTASSPAVSPSASSTVDFDFSARMEQIRGEWVIKAQSLDMGVDFFLRRTK